MQIKDMVTVTAGVALTAAAILGVTALVGNSSFGYTTAAAAAGVASGESLSDRTAASDDSGPAEAEDALRAALIVQNAADETVDAITVVVRAVGGNPGAALTESRKQLAALSGQVSAAAADDDAADEPEDRDLAADRTAAEAALTSALIAQETAADVVTATQAAFTEAGGSLAEFREEQASAAVAEAQQTSADRRDDGSIADPDGDGPEVDDTTEDDTTEDDTTEDDTDEDDTDDTTG